MRYSDRVQARWLSTLLSCVLLVSAAAAAPDGGAENSAPPAPASGPAGAQAPAALDPRAGSSSGALAPADLGALLREAQEHSPTIRAAAARLEAAGRVPSQAGGVPGPRG